MGRPLAVSETPAALLLALAVLLAAAASVRGSPWQSSRASAAVGSQAPLEEPQGPPEQGGNASAAGGKESQLRPPAVLRGGGRRGGEEGTKELALAPSLPAASIPVASYFSGGREEEENETGLCLGCPRRPGQAMEPLPEPEPLRGERKNEKPIEALLAGARVAQPSRGEAGGWKHLDGGGGGGGGPGNPPPVPRSQEELGSGDQHDKEALKRLGFAEWSTIPPSLSSATMPGKPAPGHDSAEAEVLPGRSGAAGLPSPELGRPVQTPEEAGRVQDQEVAPKEDPLEFGSDSSSSSPVEGAEGRTELAWLDAETPQSVVTPPLKAAQAPKPSLDPLASEIIDIDYYDLFDGEGLGGPSLDSTKQKPPEDKEVSWAFRDLYDDFTPFDESDFYPTTSFYTDGDEEDLEETDEEEEEEEGEDEGGGGLARGLEEKAFRGPTLAPPKIQSGLQGAVPTRHRYIVPPLQTFVISGGRAVATPRPHPRETGREGTLPVGSSENGTECRSGYIRHNASCKSLCDTFPSYCLNGGQCYLVENLGAFCRCNTQDYIWHKGVRCESIITDFQVMCVAVGSAALVVLLLFMMTVVFAKKLYLLKTENNKLRKSKYRTPSELHNDNFSLSTIAEGSHPNEDSSAPHKLQDPLKSCLKDEEPLNIQNSLSLSPKLDSRKGNPDYPDVNCLQNNLT